MKLIDKQHTQGPVRFGQMKLVEELTNTLGIPINRKRVQRLIPLELTFCSKALKRALNKKKPR